MITRFLTSASFRHNASAQAIIRTLDPGDPDLALDTHHQLIWSLFAEEAGSDGKRDFLWRYDDSRFQILSERAPSDAHRLFDMSVRTLNLRFETGDKLVFRLRANATVSRGGGKGNGRSSRHDIVMDQMLQMQAEDPMLKRHELRDEAVPIAAEKWLCRTGERAGFEFVRFSDVGYRTLELKRRAGQGARKTVSQPKSRDQGSGSPARFGVLDMDGILVVQSPELFVSSVVHGFGRGKAFGFGLMLLDRL